MLTLTVTADDFGYCKLRNKGILQLLKQGSITRTSLIVNAVNTTDAVTDFCYHVNSQERIGLHLNLTEGKPLSDVKEILSLTNKCGHFLGKHGFRDELRKGNIVETEVRLKVN